MIDLNIPVMNPNDFKFHLRNAPPLQIPDGVTAYKANKKAWPILSGITIVDVTVPFNKWRAPHYHPNAPELSIILEGKGLAGLVTPKNELLTVEIMEGDCIYFPQAWPHWLLNTGNNDLRAYFNYGFEQPETIEVPNITRHFETFIRNQTY